MHKIASITFLASVSVVSASIWYLVDVTDSSQDLVKIRNSLLYVVRGTDVYDWTPYNPPTDFLWEQSKPSSKFLDTAQKILAKNSENGTELMRTIELSHHLIAEKKRPAKPIQSNTATAYRMITEHGYGYCADYTQVLDGLALAVGIPIRECGMSFDGYGGDGHAFSEVFDQNLQKWIFIDSFYSFYLVDEEGIPLSVTQLHNMLRSGLSNSIQLVKINESKFSFPNKKKAIAYYLRGSESFYMLWGNNVYSYDENLIVSIAGTISRSAEQLVAIVLGIYPKIVIRTDWQNQKGIEELRTLKLVLLIAFSFSVLACIALAWLAMQHRPSSKRSGSRAHDSSSTVETRESKKFQQK